MIRSPLCAPLLMICFAGCFSEPPGNGPETGSSGATTTGGGTTAPTDPTLPTSSGDETTSASTPGTTLDGSSSSGPETSGTSTGAEDSSSTGGPAPICGCPEGDFEFCEGFEGFVDGEYSGWDIPGGEPPLEVGGPCGQAFRGEIGPGQSFAVIARRVLDILMGRNVDVIRVHGILRVLEGCATATPHRLLSARTDTGAEDFLYSAEIELNDGEFVLVQRPASPGEVVVDPLGVAVTDQWIPFEVTLLGLQPVESPTVRVRIGESMLEVPRIALPTPMLSFSVVPGPFAYLDASMAGCTVDFDNISVEALPGLP